MAKFILVLVVHVLVYTMAIFGSEQKKSGKIVFVIQCIARFSFFVSFMLINRIHYIPFILNSEESTFVGETEIRLKKVKNDQLFHINFKLFHIIRLKSLEN